MHLRLNGLNAADLPDAPLFDSEYRQRRTAEAGYILVEEAARQTAELARPAEERSPITAEMHYKIIEARSFIIAEAARRTKELATEAVEREKARASCARSAPTEAADPTSFVAHHSGSPLAVLAKPPTTLHSSLNLTTFFALKSPPLSEVLGSTSPTLRSPPEVDRSRGFNKV